MPYSGLFKAVKPQICANLWFYLLSSCVLMLSPCAVKLNSCAVGSCQ